MVTLFLSGVEAAILIQLIFHAVGEPVVPGWAVSGLRKANLLQHVASVGHWDHF